MARLGLLAAMLVVLISTGLALSVRSFRVQAVVAGQARFPLALDLNHNIGPTALQAHMVPASLPVYLTVLGHSGRVSMLVFDEADAAVPKIPAETEVALTHHWIDTRSLGWKFGSTRLEWNGRSYVPDRSPLRFFGTLTLIALFPLLLWAGVAVASLGFRPRKAAEGVA